MCGTPPPAGGGSKIFPKTCTQPHTLFFGGFSGFSVKKKAKNNSAQQWSKNGPKMVKSGQNCPKIGEIIGGGTPENPKKSQKISEKWVKTPPTVQSENAPKRVKMTKK